MKNKFIFSSIMVLLVIVMTMSSVLSVFAADMDASGVTTVTADNTINIPKGIILEGSLASVYSPNIVFTYSVSAGTGTSVTDNQDPAVTSVVTSGVMSAISLGGDDDGDATTGAVTFTSAEENVGEITENLVVTIGPSEFSKPGVYRYVITDTTTQAALFEAGITRPADYDTTRYLDVYVKNNDAKDGFEVYGYVLTSDGPDEITPSTTTKSEGFIESSEEYSDTYTTVDVTLTKQVTGAMGDVNHEFPFTITITNNGLSYYGKETSAATVNDDLSATSLSPSLHSGESYYLVGLSPKATVSYTETNDTVDTYTLTVTDSEDAKVNDSSDAALDGVQISPLTGTKTTAVLNVSNYPTAYVSASNNTSTAVAVTSASAVTFTNNLDEISPTGVVLRVAPYVMMLAAGSALFVVSRRRSYTDADD